jgi:RimJ/RimL family protein N-acetyltransferase
MPLSPTNNYCLRHFQSEDATQYKAIRLEALQLEAGMFSNSYATEAAYPDAHWADRLSNPNGAFWGLYDGDELIGLTGIGVQKDMPDTGYMGQSYIRKEHRGKRLSRLLYEARIAWAREHGLKRLTIGHRTINTASKTALHHFGFVYTHSETRIWPPDNQPDDILYYELLL